MDKILVVRLSSLGDILLAVPALRCLKKAFPSAQIHCLTKAAYVPLVQNLPYLSTVYSLKKGDLAALGHYRRMIKEGYSLVVDLHKNLRSCFLTFGRFQLKVIRYRKFTFRRHLLVSLHLNLLKKAPAVPERYLNCLKPLGVQDDGKGLEFTGSPRAVSDARGLLSHKGVKSGQAIALAPGARWMTKRWPCICSGFEGRAVNIAGLTDLATAGEVLRQCRALVTNDSGLMHLGCAVNLPVVAVFGSTVREFGFFPFRAKARMLECRVACRPCTTIGKETCRIKTLECLEKTTPQAVRDALSALV
jgi:heptosyltransferase-2